MRYRFLLLMIVGALICNLAYADVPKLVNFQGRLTDAAGKFVPDGNYSVTFKIYRDSTGGSSRWTEAQLVSCNKGLFNVILGAVTPIPDSIFEYPVTWLGIQVAADPEMTPRQKVVSGGYSYYALNSDKLDGLHASDFTSPVSDFGRLNVAADLYEGASTLTSKYVNTTGPDSVTSSTGSAIIGNAVGTSGSRIHGVKGYANNSGTERAYGGYFIADSAGTGTQHYGATSVGYGSSQNLYAHGAHGEGISNSASGHAAGVYGMAWNYSSGTAYGGAFSAFNNGTGEHMGVYGSGDGSSDAASYGTYGYARNASTGVAYGGYFTTSTSGTGEHYGLEARGNAASATQTFGINGYASNTSSGNAYAGYFIADSAGTGDHYGIRAYAYGDQAADWCYGAYGYGKNSSSGWAYGGYFATSSTGTGVHYGIYASGAGSNSGAIYGVSGDGYNYSDGETYGGSFYASSSGSGTHYGVYGEAFGNSDSSAYGVYGYGYNYVTGDAYGGFFETGTSGTGTHYGLRAEGNSSTAGPARGVYAVAENTSTGSAHAGYFYTPFSGTGQHKGVIIDAYGNSSSNTYGVDVVTINNSSGNAYGGDFYASSSSGTEYAVYASAPASGYAGYFSGDLTVTGVKNAAVKVDNGEYRLLYAMESPENWFEDFGEGQLVNGRALVQIDPLFAQSVNTSVKYHVFLTPGGDCSGLYVTNKTSTSFEVRELKGGNSDLSFSYRIVAKRAGYEDLRMAKMKGSTPEEMQAEQARRVAESEQERAQLKSERKQRTENQELRPKPPEEEGVKKVRREEPTMDLEKTRVNMVSEK